MPSQRRLTVETVLLPHLVLVNVVMPALARRFPALALSNTDTVYVPSFSSLRFTPVGSDLINPGLWMYLGFVWLSFGVWVYVRRNALREWRQQLLADSEFEA